MTKPESTIRLMPAASPRVESGAVQFGDDWPGTFIRGDNAGWMAMQLGAVLDGEAAATLNPFDLMTLRGLQQLLGGAIVGPAAGMVQAPESSFDGLPERGEYFRHAYGGLYRRKGLAKSTETGLPLVIYEHLWPFERGDFARPQAQWTPERFEPISLPQVRAAMKGDRAAAQEAVTQTKLARQSANSGA